MYIEGTGTDAGLSGKEQIMIALRAIVNSGGKLQMAGIYSALERVMNERGYELSEQGRSSIRFFVNRVAVKKGLIYQFDRNNKGWRATSLGIAAVTGNERDDNGGSGYSAELYEGAMISVKVNRFERSKEGRRACIDAHGVICKVCGIDFSTIYGAIGAGFIHVHHVIPLAMIKKEYKLNPISDLLPVCPNCHSMLHRKEPPYTVDELKAMMLLVNV